MQSIYDEILSLAAPYLDTRANDVHTAVVRELALHLLEHYPAADADVVLPAVILHDVGWKLVPEDQQLSAFGPKMTNPDLRRVHEIEGARIAGEILARVDYDPGKAAEVVAIIDGHDSRDAALSLNDRLVKDADKLWRFTAGAVAIDHLRFGFGRADYLGWLAGQIDAWLSTPEARAMARRCLAEA